MENCIALLNLTIRKLTPVLLSTTLTAILLLGCTRQEIKNNMFRKKDTCEIMTFNAPLTGYKTFYSKETDRLGNAVALKMRMFHTFGHTINYELKITWINPLYAIITGKYYSIFHYNDEGEEVDENEHIGVFPLKWEAHFDPHSRQLTKIVDYSNPDFPFTTLQLTYHSAKLSLVDIGYESLEVIYDEYGNILSMLDRDNEGVMYTYSDAGEGKKLSFEPSGLYISDHFTIAEMLNWVPTRPTRERTSFTGIWGDASPGDVVDRFEYSDLQYDTAGRLIGWNGNAVNSWSCGGKIF